MQAAIFRGASHLTRGSIGMTCPHCRNGSTISGEVPFTEGFFRNVGWRGAPAPAPAPAPIYITELLDDVLDGAIYPGLVFDYETDLDHIADAYQAMDERRAIKSLVRIGDI